MQLTDIFFEKKSATNPMCVKKREKYHEALRNYIICQCRQLHNIDGKSTTDIIK